MTPSTSSQWPALRVDDWTDTRDTLHMWLQIIGKIRMSYAPLVNHWWQVTTYVSPRGLCTSAIPFEGGIFDIELDFHDHQIRFCRSNGMRASFPLEAMSVADFYNRTRSALESIGVPMEINDTPNEVDPAIPFPQDTTHHSYDKQAANLFWRQLTKAHLAIEEFRSEFMGKVSPVHFFWGSMDLACTRFSGRLAPRHPGGAPNCGDWVMVEGYSHQLSSCGFWAGGGEEGAFYSYTYPVPEGFSAARIEPAEAFYSEEYQQFLLPYEAVRQAENPEEKVRQFLQSTYAAAADLGGWDRKALESTPHERLASYQAGEAPGF
ncbi:DUF5996 family protein [Actinomyces weissii]|uniref:Ava_C0101 and related proteins n=1 Tax=Actinomyces weissii TaxID=675090 RepID=A0A7T7MAV8_9ACTO|nr:DUF5996 family protein [Actinomyces weissii]QQM68120.1 hypothetical protein JG540_04615 [Actinomyces weissii]